MNGHGAITVRPPVLALTMGDARGIGPEVLLKAVASLATEKLFHALAVGVREVLVHEAARLWPTGTPLPLVIRELLDSVVEISLPGDNLPVETDEASFRGRLLDNPALCGAWAGRAVEAAVGLAMDGQVQAIVTAPLDKAALNAGGYGYPGHTEMLAHLAGDCPVAMMLSGKGLRVVCATTHIALARVPRMVTGELILSQCRIIDHDLRKRFGIKRPRIALCAMNPHLGDQGLAGDEDQRVIIPAAGKARAEGLDIHGPFSADTVFVRAARGEFDTVLAMYHDQAMIAIKMHSFGKGVNITLGLPFVRTSPDHGTALDIAGQGKADSSSMEEALRVAFQLGRKEAVQGAAS